MTINNQIKIILTAIFSIAITVFVLDSQGFIRHSSEQDSLYIAEYSLLASAPGTEQSISAKPSDFSAYCIEGRLVMRGAGKKVSADVSGLLVDKKRRAVNCSF
ncbi:hypothetical protein M3P05_09540 [Sansalvadorimonas sp. 2012CJ34-2]|uniref:Organic solvent tolerance-like N-terminal domain-containing protein n=1 Tax=Parendozoicomonas callyspongiae TaxID=2942213 RepID=A0ABT0PFS2_9GAMM|nr:hypothetical protein [Sansalvadorimonas sp. 2012CJ34-2]MCL6270175.1 hypothetical protein [Sansalvadorimonas sp. 2012CJ34-2]